MLTDADMDLFIDEKDSLPKLAKLIQDKQNVIDDRYLLADFTHNNELYYRVADAK